LLGCGSCWLELLSVFCQSPTGCAAPSSAQKCFPAFGGLGAGCGWLRAICTSGPAAATPAQRGAKRRVCISRGMKSRIRGPAGPLGLAVLRGSGGKSPKRRLRRIKRGDFEEAARLAATKWLGIVSPRRWAKVLFSKEKAPHRPLAIAQWRKKMLHPFGHSILSGINRNASCSCERPQTSCDA